MKIAQAYTLIVLSLHFFTSCEKDNTSAPQQITVIQANGEIKDDLNAFRNLLGPLNTMPGSAAGRREINWDAVPDSMEGKPLPPDFFNPTGNDAVASRQRGIAYAAKGTFMVSSNGFANINSEAASEFKPFTGSKTFANTGAAKWEVFFQVAGKATSASVKGLGIVFSDVDTENSLSLEFFDGDKSLGKFFVPPHDETSSFSFLGVYYHYARRITKVIVTHDGFLGEGTKDISDGGTRDLMVMDDFIYSEPVESSL